MKNKFKVGDKVKVINYGHKIWRPLSGDEVEVFDISPEIVGQTGTVVISDKTQGVPSYALHGINKSSWYNEDQLELIK